MCIRTYLAACSSPLPAKHLIHATSDVFGLDGLKRRIGSLDIQSRGLKDRSLRARPKTHWHPNPQLLAPGSRRHVRNQPQ